LNARAALLGPAEETEAPSDFTIRSGNPHDEDFLNASGL